MQKAVYDIDVRGAGIDGQPFEAGRQVRYGNLGTVSGPAVAACAEHLLKKGTLTVTLSATIDGAAQEPLVFNVDPLQLGHIEKEIDDVERKMHEATWKHMERKAKKHGKAVPPAPTPIPTPAFP